MRSDKVQNKQAFHFNIGALLFGALFAYLVITVILYITTDRTETYQVHAGTLSRNETYVAMVLREEEVVLAQQDGYVNYYIDDRTKAGAKEEVCVISKEPADVPTGTSDDDARADVRSIAERFSKAYDPNSFRAVYDLGFDIQSASSGAVSPGSIRGTAYEAAGDGIVVYSSDGFESKGRENITRADFRPKAYQKTQLRGNDAVTYGTPIYRLITDDRWSIVVPLTERQAEALEKRDQIRVRFARDGETERGAVELFESEGDTFAQITFSNGMVRYCNDRFLEVELLTNTRTGLKIPRSSVVEKQFFTIPAAYATEGGQSGNMGFMVEETNEKGETSSHFEEAEVYEHVVPEKEGEEELYYVDDDPFRAGDVLIKPNSNERYEIGPTAALQGVYCTNKGYAVFRKIVIIDQDEESCIVENGTSFGLSAYDFIVRNGADVNEEQIIHPE